MTGDKILAINPGAKEMGIAVLDGEDLLYYGVKTVRFNGVPGGGIVGAAERIVRRLVDDYRPDYLAVEKPNARQRSASRIALVSPAIRELAKREGLVLREFAMNEVRRFTDEGKTTKKEIAKWLVGRYPELEQYLLRRSKWERQYYAHMFGAVAISWMCYWFSRHDTASLR